MRTARRSYTPDPIYRMAYTPTPCTSAQPSFMSLHTHARAMLPTRVHRTVGRRPPAACRCCPCPRVLPRARTVARPPPSHHAPVHVTPHSSLPGRGTPHTPAPRRPPVRVALGREAARPTTRRVSPVARQFSIEMSGATGTSAGIERGCVAVGPRRAAPAPVDRLAEPRRALARARARRGSSTAAAAAPPAWGRTPRPGGGGRRRDGSRPGAGGRRWRGVGQRPGGAVARVEERAGAGTAGAYTLAPGGARSGAGRRLQRRHVHRIILHRAGSDVFRSRRAASGQGAAPVARARRLFVLRAASAAADAALFAAAAVRAPPNLPGGAPARRPARRLARRSARAAPVRHLLVEHLLQPHRLHHVGGDL